MTKHTPGPWVACDWGYIVADDPTGRHEDIYIAEVCREDDEGRIVPPIEQQANARLIAAAPDLLAACQALMRAEAMQTEGKRDGATMGQISLAIDAARAAITKAQGEG